VSTKLEGRVRPRLLTSLALTFVVPLAPAGAASGLTLGKVAPPGLGGCTDCEVLQRNGRCRRAPLPGARRELDGHLLEHAGRRRRDRARPASGLSSDRHARSVQDHQADEVGDCPGEHGHPSFATSLAVKGGDLLGLVTVDNLVSAYSTNVAGDTVSTVPCGLSVGGLVGRGTPCKLGSLTTHLVNVSATLVPR
jgi:hypothetical protein